MRILMTTDTVGGVWTYAMELAEALAAQGVGVELATMGPPPSAAQRGQAAAIAGLRLHVGDYRLEWMDEPWADVAAAGDWLLALERKVEPTAIHLNNYAHGALPWRAPVVMVGHSCVCSWWEAVHGGDAPATWDRYRQEVAAGLHAADVVVAPTHAMLSSLMQHYGNIAHWKVITNARSSTRFAPAPAEPIIFAAGRLWDAGKNIAALEAIAEDVPWPIHLAGDLAEHGDGKPIAPERGLRRLGLLSPEQMAHWLARASIYALPARYEPFGLSVLEAALSGCALVLGDIESLREVWSDAAVYVPPDDHRALRRALRQLTDDTTYREDMSARARRRAARYAPHIMAERYLALYAGLVRNRNRPLIRAD